ncbi:MAG: LysR family transcriptional regulator [Xanthobacteraceae bacterium]
MERLSAMRTFVTVAKLGSFAEAARRMRLSPSVVTRAIAQLEDQLGLTLLMRTTRSLRLTEGGEIYLGNCQQILADVDSAERQARGENAEPSGNLKAAAPILFGRLHVLPVINRVLQMHRALSIQLSLSDRNINLVDEGIDVAVRIGDLGDSSLIAVKLGEVSRVMVASPGYLKARGTPRSPTELADHDIIAFEGIGSTDEWRFNPGRKLIRVEPRLSVNSADAAIAAAEAGVGITRTLSYQIKAPVLAGRLKLILQQFAPPQSPVNAIYPARRVASANVAVFVKAARDYFKAHPLTPVAEWKAR